eukprot:TRINITY_DN2382_c0_g1_i1.p2 TRINITY_DN2382_c0_g1~~TRINITY_DN2382_c0_g1_i1.p2  ORF type:complete len:255 (+),score=28.01 TRINITY_DN2382_c0_g1_i1:562-1326(+)
MCERAVLVSSFAVSSASNHPTSSSFLMKAHFSFTSMPVRVRLRGARCEGRENVGFLAPLSASSAHVIPLVARVGCAVVSTVIPLRKKSAQVACGVDGWRVSELRCPPAPLIDALAATLNAIACRGEWPAALRLALVTMIPKSTDSGAPLDLRPITVTSCIYRLWACRRLQDMVAWQERWICPSQHGFRPGHRGDDVVYRLALEIEDALLGGDELYGLALDFSKCFDRVPQRIVPALVADLGLAPTIVKPLTDMY